MRFSFLSLLVAFGLTTLSGCTHVKYRVWFESKSFSRPLVHGVRRVFVVAWYEDEISAQRVSEYQLFVERGLAEGGFRVVGDITRSDFVITFHTERQQGRQLGSISTQVAPEEFVLEKEGQPKPFTRGMLLRAYRTQEFIRFREARRAFTDPSSVPPPKEVWRTMASSAGVSANMTEVLPALLAASAPALGRNTPISTVVLDQGDKRIEAIRKGTQNQMIDK